MQIITDASNEHNNGRNELTVCSIYTVLCMDRVFDNMLISREENIVTSFFLEYPITQACNVAHSRNSI